MVQVTLLLAESEGAAAMQRVLCCAAGHAQWAQTKKFNHLPSIFRGAEPRQKRG
jgi:hypothetical protein